MPLLEPIKAQYPNISRADLWAHAANVADLSRRLREAARAAHPASGTPPIVQEGLWAPIVAAP